MNMRPLAAFLVRTHDILNRPLLRDHGLLTNLAAESALVFAGCLLTATAVLALSSPGIRGTARYLPPDSRERTQAEALVRAGEKMLLVTIGSAADYRVAGRPLAAVFPRAIRRSYEPSREAEALIAGEAAEQGLANVIYLVGPETEDSRLRQLATSLARLGLRAKLLVVDQVP